ncbi:MAG TPA: amidohydrolase, partial [Croceibacterium sp.]|nr:amidohydrolase [Croceibacterium sp.]
MIVRGLRRGAWLAAALASASSIPATAKNQVDLIIYDAHVLTVDKGFSIASAVAVKGDKIVAVGGDEIRANYAATRELDLDGRTLMPGFTDTHLHPQAVAPSDI